MSVNKQTVIITLAHRHIRTSMHTQMDTQQAYKYMLNSYVHGDELVITVTEGRGGPVLRQPHGGHQHKLQGGILEVGRIFEGRYTWEQLPHSCRVWLGLAEVKDMLEGAVVEQDGEGLRVCLGIPVGVRGREHLRQAIFELRELHVQEERGKGLQEQGAGNVKQEQSENQDSVAAFPTWSHSSPPLAPPLAPTHNHNQQDQLARMQHELRTAQQAITKIEINNEQMNKFMHSCMHKMQTKWQLLTQEIGQLRHQMSVKQRQRRRSLIRRSLESPNCDYLRATQVKVDYYFSQRNRHADIKSINKKTAACFSNDKTFKIVMVEPTNFPNVDNYYKCYYRLDVRIRCVRSYIAVGICEKEVARGLKFVENEHDVKGHGCYLLDWHGEMWSNYRQDSKSRPFKALRFHEMDVIRLVFKPFRKTLKISKLGRPEHVIMALDPRLRLSEICFCAFLSGEGDQVEIVGNEEPVCIDIQQQQAQAQQA